MKKTASPRPSLKEKDKKPQGKSQKNNSSKHNRLASLFIFAFAFLLYANTLNFGYALDDDVVYRKNGLVQQGVSGLKDIFTHSFIFGFTGHNDQSYRPMVQAVYAIERSLFGPENPHAQHFVNVLFFALCCVLLYKVLQKMFLKFSLPDFSVGAFHFSVPFFMALLFAAHPVHTESVANIKGLDDILNFFFFILSLYFIFRHIETGRKLFFFLAPVFFFLSLLCKEMAVTFLVIIPMAVFFFTNQPVKKILQGWLPFLAAFVIYFIIRKSVLDVVTFEEKMKVINNALAAAQNGSERLATALLMLGKYMLLLFYPHPLSFDYSYNQIPIVGFSDIKVILTVVVFAALLSYAGIIFFRSLNPENRKANQDSAVWAFCILFFFVSMSVVSNIFILIGATMGDRFLFTPSLAFCIAVPFFVNRFGKNVLFGLTGIILVLFSFKTIDRNKDWKDNFSLFLSAADACPNSTRVQSSLGSSYREQAEQEKDMIKRGNLYGKAIEQYIKAVKILPENTEALYNMGVCYYAIGDHDNALKAYEQTLKISPEYTNAANNAGVIYFERRDYERAKVFFEQALKYQQNNSDALGNLGAIHHNLGNMKEAVDYYKKALAINPGNQNVRGNLAKAESALKAKN